MTCSASSRGTRCWMSRIMEAAQRDCGSPSVRSAWATAAGRGAWPCAAAIARTSATIRAATAAPSAVASTSPIVPRSRQVIAAPAASIAHFSQRSWVISIEARAATCVAAKASASASTGGVSRPPRSPNSSLSIGLLWRIVPSAPASWRYRRRRPAGAEARIQQVERQPAAGSPRCARIAGELERPAGHTSVAAPSPLHRPRTSTRPRRSAHPHPPRPTAARSSRRSPRPRAHGSASPTSILIAIVIYLDIDGARH